MHNRPHVVIIGGGFAGLNAARGLKHAPVDVTLIDRRNFHLFQPLLYQVATGALSPANIAAPLRAILKRQKNTTVLLGEVSTIDTERKRVHLADGEIPYDTLILATGAGHNYFGNRDWQTFAPSLKTVEDATTIRRRILLSFEAAEREEDEERRRRLLTFVVVGAGPTGVELAGAISEISRYTLAGNFRRVDPSEARVMLLEGADRVLLPYPEELSEQAKQSLEELGVEVHLGTFVKEVSSSGVIAEKDDSLEQIPAETILWAAGVKASGLGAKVAEDLDAEVDKAGRVTVNHACQVPGHPDYYILGDLAAHPDGDGGTLPGIAPVAIQQGAYVAKRIKRMARGRQAKPFRYRDHGMMATIGRAAAVADLGWAKIHGLVGWILWLFVHLMYLVRFENRLMVLMQWGWNYLTRNRTARLITGSDPWPLVAKSDPGEEGEKTRKVG